MRTTPSDQAQPDVLAVAIDGYSPTFGLVQRGVYPFWAIERMYTRRNPDGLSLSFIDRVTADIQTSDRFIRVQDVPDDVLASHE